MFLHAGDEMKRLRVLAMLLLIASSVVILPSSAKKSGYSAQGSIDTYLPELPHAMVVDGHWSLNVKEVHGEYKISFNAFYRELNLGGEGAHPYDQAVGLIDHFWLTLEDAAVVEMDDEHCVIDGILHVKAKHWDPDTLKPWWDPPYPWVWGNAVVYAGPDDFLIDWDGAAYLLGSLGEGNSPEFMATGTIDSYEEGVESSEVIGGSWTMMIKDGMASFSGSYRELNIDPVAELSPAGSVDMFRMWMETGDYYFDGDTLVVEGEMNRDKKMWFLDSYDGIELPGWFDPDWIPEHGNVAWIYDFMPGPCLIIVSPDGMQYDFWINDNWVYGSTRTYRLV